jgi:UDP-N-acetylglucosamine transferase subunit ALG13
MTAPVSGGNGGPGAPRVVVTVGTDHHPFDRLIGWINDCLAQHPEQSGGFFVQSGTASITPACPGSRFLPTDQLDALLDGAEVIVCHGGPASIASAWARGQLPIVVPRLRRLGEHIDDHQLDFCVQVAEVGRIRLAQTAADFAEYLDEAAHDSRRFRGSGLQADVDAAVARFGALVEELVGRPSRRPLLAHRARRSRRAPETDNGLPATIGSLSPGLIPAVSTTWHASGSSACVGLPGLANEEQEQR